MELYANSDQLQVLFAPGDKVTWAEKGLKQVAIANIEEKHAFTVMVTITSDGNLLPIQAIYSRKTSCSCPLPNSPHHKDLINAGCLIQESGTTTYWSNLRTMKDFVNKKSSHLILINKKKISTFHLHRNPSGQSMSGVFTNLKSSGAGWKKFTQSLWLTLWLVDVLVLPSPVMSEFSGRSSIQSSVHTTKTSSRKYCLSWKILKLTLQRLILILEFWEIRVLVGCGMPTRW